MNKADNKERPALCRMRAFMKEKHIDCCVVLTSDDHQSEYVHEYFKFREYVSGFTGSAGTLVVTQTGAGLWTDSRYFLQADEQLYGSGIDLYKMGEANVESWTDYAVSHVSSGGCLYVDGRTLSAAEGIRLEKICAQRDIRLCCEGELAQAVWIDRPEMKTHPIYALPREVCGFSMTEKLARLRTWMAEHKSDIHMICALDDIAWLFNLRGGDIAYSPLFLAYARVEADRVYLYVDGEMISEELYAYLEMRGVCIRAYQSVYEDAASVRGRISFDPDKINYTLYRLFAQNTGNILSEYTDPVMLMKCVKNEAEISAVRKAHEKDGAAFVKFLYWLSCRRGEALSEIQISDRLEQFRMKQSGYMYPSFAPISGFAEHGAIVHYSATVQSDRTIDTDGLLLLDTGAHYNDGSTDITRTIGFGIPDYEQKMHFTHVLRAMLRLAFAKFHADADWTALDYAARSVLWNEGLHFGHGTGHGVGFLGTIHEPPVGFRMKSGRSAFPPTENMIITDEPGLYIEGSHGIRLENELLIRPWRENEFGRFMEFEILTLVPIDKTCILPEFMSHEEKCWLNTYHQMVYDKIRPYVSDDEGEWLRTACAPL